MCVRNRILNSLCGDGALITHFRRAFPGSWKLQALLGKTFCCAGSHLGGVSDLNVQERHSLERILLLLFVFEGSSVIPKLRSTQQYSLQWIVKNRAKAHTWATIKWRKEKGVYMEKKSGRKKSSSLSADYSCMFGVKDRCTIFSSLLCKSLIQPW